MINVLGLFEVEGMVVVVDVVDVMFKVVNVCLFSYEVFDLGRLMLVVEGDLVVCCVVLDVGVVVVWWIGCVISCWEIGCLEEDIQWLIGGFQLLLLVFMLLVDLVLLEVLLMLLVLVCQGMMVGEVVVYFVWLLDKVCQVLEQFFFVGML